MLPRFRKLEVESCTDPPRREAILGGGPFCSAGYSAMPSSSVRAGGWMLAHFAFDRKARK
jgi:hypothetical protein